MAQLIYTGKTLAEVGVVPLPEGWPAFNHDEPDEAAAAEKVASGSYRFEKPPRTKTPPAGEEE